MKRFCTILPIFFLFISVTNAQTTAREWYDKAASLKKEEKYNEAIEALKKSTALQANYTEAWELLAWCYNETGLYQEALETLKKEEKINPAGTATMNFEFGYAYKGLKKYDQALPYFDKAISLNSDLGNAYKERGNTYFKLKEYEKALADYNKYDELTEDNDDATFFYNKGWTENDLGKYEEAVKSLSRCVDLDVWSPDGFTELGYSHYKLKQNKEAIDNYLTAIKISKEPNSLAILGIAEVYYDNLKNYDSALVYYEKGEQLKKNDKTLYYRLGWCYNDKERYNDAVQPLKQAIQLDQEYTDASTELGYAYYKLQKYDEALAQFLPIMNRNEKNELSRYYAGFCYQMKGDQENLKKMIDELTALNSSKYVETLKKYLK